MDGHHFLDPSGNTRALIGHALALDLDCLRRHLALAGPNAGPDAVPICMLAGAAEHMHAHWGADPRAVDRPHARMAGAAITSERGSPCQTTILHADALCIWPMHDCMSAWETSRFHPAGRPALLRWSRHRVIITQVINVDSSSARRQRTLQISLLSDRLLLVD